MPPEHGVVSSNLTGRAILQRFCPLKYQVEWLSVSGIETYRVDPAVRNDRFQKFGSFGVVLLNV